MNSQFHSTENKRKGTKPSGPEKLFLFSPKISNNYNDKISFKFLGPIWKNAGPI